jgi:hypothetical protein
VNQIEGLFKQDGKPAVIVIKDQTIDPPVLHVATVRPSALDALAYAAKVRATLTDADRERLARAAQRRERLAVRRITQRVMGEVGR